MIFGEVYRYNGEWKFSAVGEGIDANGIIAAVREVMKADFEEDDNWDDDV